MDTATKRQARSAAAIQGCRLSDLSYAEGPVWHATSPDNWVRPELAAAVWVGLGRAGAITRNDAVNAQRYLGRTLWRRWSGYHRRSRFEIKMHCIKLLGQSLMARDFERQVAGIQICIAVLNRYTALGIPVTEPVG